MNEELYKEINALLTEAQALLDKMLADYYAQKMGQAQATKGEA